MIRQAHACRHRDRDDRFARYICKTAAGIPASSCGPAAQRCSSAQTCVGDRVSSFILPTHPHAHSLIPSHPLITHTHALKWQQRESAVYAEKTSSIQSGQSELKKGGEGDGEGREDRVCVFVCVCVCDASTFCSL